MATQKTTKTTSAKKTTTKTSSTKSTAPKEPSRKTDLTTSNQTYAQMINFAELQRILQQNISKGSNRTYSQYTKEKLKSYIKNPLANIDNIRDISAFLYRVSHNYKKIIEYYSYTPLLAIMSHTKFLIGVNRLKIQRISFKAIKNYADA